MVKPNRGGAKLAKKKAVRAKSAPVAATGRAGARAQAAEPASRSTRGPRAAKVVAKPRAKASAARLRRDVAAPPAPSPNVQPVRTSYTPRPEFSVPLVSIENVDWEDTSDPVSPLESWSMSQRALDRRLEELGAITKHEHVLDLSHARCTFLDADRAPAVEARAQLVGTWIEGSDRLVMAWADPVLAPLAIARLDEMGDALHLDAATARALVLRAVEGAGAEHVLALTTPLGEHYVALRGLVRAGAKAHVHASTPVAAVLYDLGELRRSVEGRSEPTDVLRARFVRLGRELVEHAHGICRDTEWVGRLERTGRGIERLAGRLAPPTFTAIAAGREADEWVSPVLAADLVRAITLLEDEWGAFH
jgi:hypothetical protein